MRTGPSLVVVAVVGSLCGKAVSGQQELEVVGPRVLGEDRPWTRLAGVATWSDGRVLVAEATLPELTMFGEHGQVRWRTGQRGAGPGEYRQLAALRQCTNGDLLVRDGVLSRFDLLDEETGAVHEAWRDMARGNVAGCQSARDVYWLQQSGERRALPSRGTTFVRERTLVRRRPDGTVDLLGVGTFETYMGGMVGTDYPVGGERAFFPIGDTAAYVCQGHTGECLLNGTIRVQLRLPDKALTESAWQHAIRLRSQEVGAVRESHRRELLRMYREIPRPKTFGRFEQAVADDRGRLWLKTYDTYGTGHARWVVYTAAGQAVAVLRLPEVFELLLVRGNRLTGQVQDPEGVPTVHQYEVRPGGR